MKNGSFQHSRSDSIDTMQQAMSGGPHEATHSILHAQSMTASAYKKNISDMQQQQPMTPGSLKYPNSQQHSMALNHINSSPAAPFSSPISSNNGNNNGNYSTGKSQYQYSNSNSNSNPHYPMHSPASAAVASWMSPISQQQSKYNNVNDYMSTKNVSQPGGSNGGNNIYIGSVNPNNNMLSSLRDGSSEVFASGAVLTNDYDPAMMPPFYSPNRQANPQAHRRSNTGGSFTGSDYGTTEKVKDL